MALKQSIKRAQSYALGSLIPNHKSWLSSKFLTCKNKDGIYSIFILVWAGVDSNHRTLARTDLQSVAFSHSATYPYLFVIILYNVLLNLVWLLKMPLTRFELVASPLPRECSTPEPQGHLDSRKAGNGTRTYNLRFTKPLICQLSYAGLVFV